jgi:hypothetical protein
MAMQLEVVHLFNFQVELAPHSLKQTLPAGAIVEYTARGSKSGLVRRRDVRRTKNQYLKLGFWNLIAMGSMLSWHVVAG